MHDDLQPTARFWFVKHFTNLTPPDADALGTSSDQAGVLFTAFAGGGDYTLHVANLGAAREIAIEGVPGEVKSLRAVVTSVEDSFREMGPVAVEGGAARLKVPARSLVTLTTQKPGPFPQTGRTAGAAAGQQKP